MYYSHYNITRLCTHCTPLSTSNPSPNHCLHKLVGKLGVLLDLVHPEMKGPTEIGSLKKVHPKIRNHGERSTSTYTCKDL